MDLSRWAQTVLRARALVAEAGSLQTVGREDVDAVWLRSAVRWLAEVAPTWAEMDGAPATERSYRRLCASPSIEAWLICWPTDGHLELHDHGGASGSFAVVEGVLEEQFIRDRVRPDGSLDDRPFELHQRVVAAGAAVAFDGGYVHDVRNSTGPTATTVHVYSAARRAMSFYRLDGGLIRSVELGASRSLIEAEVTAGTHG